MFVFQTNKEQVMKRCFMSAALPIMLVLAAGAARAQSVKTDYDRNFDLSLVKTFNFYKLEMGQQDLTVGNPALDQTIQQELTRALAAAGIRQADNPDLLIAYYGAIDQTSAIYLTSLGYIGPSSWRYGGYILTADRMNVVTGSLIVDFISTATGKAFWRGIASKSLVDRSASSKDVQKAADRLARQFQKDLERQQKENRAKQR